MLQDYISNHLNVSIHPVLSLLFLLIIHFIFGKKVTFPLGILAGFQPYLLGIICSAFDTVLIIMILEAIQLADKISYFRKIREKRLQKAEKWKDTKRFKYFVENNGYR